MAKSHGINKGLWVTLGVVAAVAGGFAGSQVNTMGQAYDLARREFSEAEVRKYTKEIDRLTWAVAGEKINLGIDTVVGKDTAWREKKIDSMAKRVEGMKFDKYRIGTGRLSFLEHFKVIKGAPKFFKPTLPKTAKRMKQAGMGAGAGAGFIALGAAAAAIRRRRSHHHARR